MFRLRIILGRHRYSALSEPMLDRGEDRQPDQDEGDRQGKGPGRAPNVAPETRAAVPLRSQHACSTRLSVAGSCSWPFSGLRVASLGEERTASHLSFSTAGSVMALLRIAPLRGTVHIVNISSNSP